ncbi:hypothetical protein Cgig2_017463 [Carnegiea gigantea]|uniref:DUF4283 domain-containing protein n=1 Tax=Carnegiea gigantea TaxID=171969 RepID=A0A9Q1GW05_9CARY|nr:hypothetical protein Cgig2_017463 [Carnegiea gigantea]
MVALDTLQRNNPNPSFNVVQSSLWEEDQMRVEVISDDDEPIAEDDPTCPTTILTKEEKRQLRKPWRHAIIIRMFDKAMGYLQLKRRLQTKWALKGDFSLIEIDYDYYVMRFANLEDYEHVMTQGPWVLGDNYLVIREWVPNFIPEEHTISKFMAWVHIPGLSVEYFNKNFLLHMIGQKIGRVIRVDDATANVERGAQPRRRRDVWRLDDCQETSSKEKPKAANQTGNPSRGLTDSDRNGVPNGSSIHHARIAQLPNQDATNPRPDLTMGAA